MSIAQEKLAEIRTQVQSHLDRRQTGALSAARRAALESTIRGHLSAHNAVIVAHYYTAPEIQALAEATGGCVSDSLEMARFGRPPGGNVNCGGCPIHGRNRQNFDAQQTGTHAHS